MFFVETKSVNAAFHFSTEEFLMQRFGLGPVIMLWQADKCVMLGANQVALAEVNMSFAQQEKINIVRRSSGGGAIFTDMGTLLYTMIQPYQKESAVMQIAKETIVGSVIGVLNKMGVPAVLEGRNDILANGKKFSGIAQYVRHDMLCTHGSLLYDTDLEMLTNVLNVDDEKIHSKAIRSVRSRVTNIKDYMGLSTGNFIELLKTELISLNKAQPYVLTSSELNEIEKICKEKYENTDWTFGKSPAFSFSNSKRFPDGKIEVYLDIKKGVVTSCAIRGDFLGVAPIRALEEKLENISFQYEAFVKVLDEVSLSSFIGDITKEQLLLCIFENGVQ